MNIERKNKLGWLLGFLLLGVLFFLNLWVGSVMLPGIKILHALFSPDSASGVTAVIVNQYRLPQAVTALSTGIVLSLSGLILQTLFRNPLAGPSVLGISSGASLGVAIVILAGSLTGFTFMGVSLLGNTSIVLAAFAGALLVLSVILYVSGRIGNILTVLIIGIMLGYTVSALVSILQYFSGSDELHAYVLWGLGSFSNTSPGQSLFLLVIAFIGGLFTFFYIKPLNALLLGEQYAKSLGFNTRRIQTVLILFVGILIAAGTAFTGPIAFLGLAVPHITRGIFKSSQHRILVPGTILMGASIALLCNLLAKLPGMDVSLPINAVTSLVGAPVIIVVLLKSRQLKSVK